MLCSLMQQTSHYESIINTRQNVIPLVARREKADNEILTYDTISSAITEELVLMFHSKTSECQIFKGRIKVEPFLGNTLIHLLLFKSWRRRSIP